MIDRDEAIQWAKDAGFVPYEYNGDIIIDELEKLQALIIRALKQEPSK